jgi:hypothetical protein
MSEEKTLFETMGIQYEKKDGLLYPIFSKKATTEDISVRKHGNIWVSYLFCKSFSFINLKTPSIHYNRPYAYGRLQGKSL